MGLRQNRTRQLNRFHVAALTRAGKSRSITALHRVRRGLLTLIAANAESLQISVDDAKLLAPTRESLAMPSQPTTFREIAGELSSRAPAAMIVLSSASPRDGYLESLGACWASKR